MKLALILAFGVAFISAQEEKAVEVGDGTLLTQNTFNAIDRVTNTIAMVKAEDAQMMKNDVNLVQMEVDERVQENTFNAVDRVTNVLAGLQAQKMQTETEVQKQDEVTNHIQENAQNGINRVLNVLKNVQAQQKQSAEKETEVQKQDEVSNHIKENAANGVDRVLNVLKTAKAANNVMNRTSRNPRHTRKTESDSASEVHSEASAEEGAQSLNDIATTEKMAANSFVIREKKSKPVTSADANGIVKTTLVQQKSAEKSGDDEKPSGFLAKAKDWVVRTATKVWNGLSSLWSNVMSLFSAAKTKVMDVVQNVKEYIGAN